MRSFAAVANGFFNVAPQLLIPLRWWVLAGFLALSFANAVGLYKHFEMDMSPEAWFDDDDPVKIALDQYRYQFGSDDGVYVVFRPQDGDVFSEKSLLTLKSLHRELETYSYADPTASPYPILARIEDIDSLYNARYQKANGDTLISRELLGDQAVESHSQLEELRAIADSQETFKLSFFANDYQYGGIRIKTDFGVVPVADIVTQLSDQPPQQAGDDYLSDDFGLGLEFSDIVDSSAEVTEIEFESTEMDAYLEFMTALRSVLGQEQYSHFDFYFTGNAPVMDFAMQSMLQGMNLLLIMAVVVVAILWVLFRSFSAVLWSLVVINASILWTIGIGSWLGITFSTMVLVTFMLTFAVGIADCVHVLSAYMINRNEGHDHLTSTTLAYRKTGLPILLTTITTMVGMSALALSDIVQIKIFGISSALAVGCAFLFTVFLLPVLLDIWPPSPAKRKQSSDNAAGHPLLQPLLSRIPAFTKKYRKPIVIAYVVLFGLLIVGAFQVNVNSNIAELAKEGSSIQTSFNLVDSHMMGAQNMEIYMDFGEPDALKDPRVLKRIDELQSDLFADFPEFVIKTFSLADYVKDTHRLMQEGEDQYYTIPDDPRLVAQLLYLFNNANAEDRRKLVSDDYSISHLSLQLRNAGSYEYSGFYAAVQERLNDTFKPLEAQYPNMDLQLTGTLTLMMRLIDYIAWTQLKSFSAALLIITCIMIVTLGSVQGGAISIIPNLLPAVFTFGVMGAFGIPLDTDTLIVAPLIIGIAVDDTIHFLAHYRDAWFEHGDIEIAMKKTLQEVGQAVTFTSLILGIGFGVLVFSDYLGFAKPGFFGSAAIFVALTSDLLFLPALIQWLKPDLGRSKRNQIVING